MRDELFDRIVNLRVFNTETNTAADGSMKLVNIANEGKLFSSRQPDGSPGFRIKFHVNKVMEVTPNPVSIWIYNLGPDSRAMFEKLNNTIILEAGYGNNPKKIFTGNVSRGRTIKEGASDYVTHIEAADGLFAIQNSRINQAFSEGMRTNAVINSLVGALQNTGTVGVGQISGVPNDGYNNGIVLSGNAMDKLKAVCDGKNLNFFLENGLVYILPIGVARQGAPLLISPDTGLIGIPERRDVGMAFKSLLNPDISVFIPIIIKSKFINGIFNTVKVEHVGDSYQGDFATNVETTFPNTPAVAS